MEIKYRHYYHYKNNASIIKKNKLVTHGEKMKIVIVIDLCDYLTNGTVMTAYRFVEELKKKGHTVKVVATGAKGEDCYEVPERYIPLVTEVARLQQIRFGKPVVETLMNAFQGADVIHFYLPFKLEKKGRKIAEQMGIPTTSAFHLQPENVTYNAGLKWSKLAPLVLYSGYKTRFYKYFDHIHCPSVFIADQLRKHKYKAKLHAISNGVDRDFVPSESKRELDMDRIKILMVGRYANEKRQDVLIKAIAKSKYADKIHLTLAGKGPNLNRYKRLAEKYLKNPVTFGFYNKEELIDVINDSDIYVHAADVEIEAIACIEAFACGVVPIIANSPKSATPQFALDDRSLFKAGSAKSLAEKIDYWLDHTDELKDMSKKYVEHGKKYSIDYSISKAEEMFKEAIADYKEKHMLSKKEMKKKSKQFVKKSKIFRFFSWLLYYLIATPVVWLIATFGYGLKIKGKKNLKKVKKSGAVSVSNHVHLLDATFNALALHPNKVVFTALEQNFKIPGAGLVLSLIGAMPVPDNIKDTRFFMRTAKDLLKKKRIVHIYPEGHLINYYAGVREFNRGAFKMACNAQVPILPLLISWRERKGLFKILLPSKPCATITILDPIKPNYILRSREQEKDLMSRTYEAMTAEYEKLNANGAVDYYKMNDITPEEFKTKNQKKEESLLKEADNSLQIATDEESTNVKASDTDAENNESNT